MKEGDRITTKELVDTWREILVFYDQMIDRQGMGLRPIRILVRHIIQHDYAKSFFVGNSIYKLLISLPVNSVIDYTRTLTVDYNQLTQTVTFKYWNCQISHRKNENVDWFEECQATEVNDTFEHFLNENQDWKEAVKTRC